MRLVKMACKNLKESFALICVLLIIYNIPKAESLNCFVQDGPHEPATKMDCQMHNACRKVTDSKTMRLVEKNCYLSPGTNDTCFMEGGQEVCWCHEDFCNEAAAKSTLSLHHWISALLLPLLAYHLVIT